MRYFIDSNTFLRALISDSDTNLQSDCIQLLEGIEVGAIDALTSNLVLSEINWVMRSVYNVQKKDILKSLRSILSSKITIVDDIQTEHALDLYAKHSVKIIDAFIASFPEISSKKWVVVSYDKDFDKLGVIRKEPREVLKEVL